MIYGFNVIAKSRTALVALSLALAATAPLAAEDRIFRIMMHEGDHDEKLKYSAKPRDGYSTQIAVDGCPELDDPILKGTRRNTIEVMFICHALRRGDIADTIQLVAIPNPRRALTLLANGRGDAYGTSLPLGDLSDEQRETLMVTDPVIEDNQFFVGLFTGVDRDDVLALDTREDLLNLRSITVESWSGDVRTMTELPFADVVFAPHYQQLAPMIANNRADITFANLDREIVYWGDTPMKRIEGFKAALLGTRHMIVSPDQQDMYNHLQALIREGRAMEEDAILAAYYHSSFLSRDYDEWETLMSGENAPLNN